MITKKPLSTKKGPIIPPMEEYCWCNGKPDRSKKIIGCHLSKNPDDMACRGYVVSNEDREVSGKEGLK